MKQQCRLFMVVVWSIFCTSVTVVAQKTFSGKVTDNNGDPLIGVSVTLKGSGIGTISDVDGMYSIGVPSNNGTLQFSYIGFGLVEFDVANASATLNVTMNDDVNFLDEVVVTGLATNVKRSNLANSVARIDAADLVGLTPQSTVDGALYGKFKGAEIRANSGAPGGGMSFKLRGTTSINGSSQPLIILDGVFVDNSSIPAGLNVVSAAASGGSTSNQDNPSNRLADLNPNDIESVEILKGASAAAIYGSRASGGVVIITTKRGFEGPTKYEVAQSIGQTSMLNPLGVRQWDEAKVLGSAFADDIAAFRSAQSAGKLYNYEDLLFGNKGLTTNTRFSMTGGDKKSKFFVGASYKNEEGIVNNTGYEKISGRINFDHQLSNSIDVNLSTNYIWSSADRGFFNNDNSGTTMGIAFTSTPSWAQLLPDERGNYPSNPYAPSNFLETAAKITNNETVNRFISGGTVTGKIFTRDNSSLKLILRGGLDFYNLNTQALFPNTIQFQRDGAGLNGVSVQGFTRNLNTNVSAFLVHSYDMSSGLNLRTSFGVTNEKFNRNTILGQASNLIGIQTNLDQSGSRNITQVRLIQEDKGFFAQEEINYKDQIIATVGLRGDKSSNNSDVNKLYYYPKANVAVNLHKLGLFEEDGFFDLVKVRAAYGESGNFATFGAKSTILNSSIVNGIAGVSVPSLLGNSAVGPERQKELEFGFDLGFMKNFGFDFTYYIKNVDDLLLNADLPSSSGFTSQVTNAAALQNKGIEIGLNLGLINTKEMKWLARFNFWKNTAEVTRLDVPAFTSGGFADFLGNYMVKQGYSPTTIIGVGTAPTVTLNGEGAPTLQVYGNAEPDFQLSWQNQLTFGNFDFSMLWHWKKGGENINLSALLFDLNETTWDFDDKGLDPTGTLANGPYRLSQLGANTAPYVEDSGYIRLREVGLYYRLAKGKLIPGTELKFGVSGNNLINIFDYRSYDPEVSNFGAGGLSSGVEVNPFPSSKRFDFHIIANF